MKITVSMVTTEQQMIDAIMLQFKEFSNNALQRAMYRIVGAIKDRIKELIMDSPVAVALNDDLSKQLGVTPEFGKSAIDEIVTVIQSSMEVVYEPINVVGNVISSGGYTIKILRSDFSDVLSVQNATYSTTKGMVIPWINWLLFSGDTAVIYGYRLELDPHAPANSRTGAIMVKAPGEAWSVPSEYAGTQDDNFLTRALMPLEEDIGNIVLAELSI